MTPVVASPAGMLERITRVEQQYKNLQTLGVALLVLTGLELGAVATMLVLNATNRAGGLTSRGRVLEAERVVLRDAEGKVHGELALDPHGSVALSLYDSEGIRRAQLGTNGLYLSDPRGTVQASLRLMPGSTQAEAFTPVLRLSDGQGSPRGSLVVHRDGASSLLLSNADGHGGATLESEPDGAGHLALSGHEGRSAAWLGTLPDNSRAFLLSDSGGDAIAMLSIGTSGATQLSLSDRAHRERVVVTVLPDGSPHFALTGRTGKGAASLDVTPSGAPILELSAPDGAAGATLIAAGASAGLLFRDRHGRDVAGLDTEAGRWPRLFLSGEGGHVASMLTVSPDGAPSLGLFDARGRARALLGQFALSNPKGKAFAYRGAPFSLTFLNEAGDVIRRVPR